MSKKPDLSLWLTKGEAAGRLGVAEKTIERMVKRGQLQQAVRRRPGTASISVFHPGDVEKLTAEQTAVEKPGAFVMPAEKPGALIRAGSSTELAPANLLEILIGAAKRPAGVQLTDKLYLTIKEAAALSGLPETYLKAARKDGRLKSLKTGAGYRIKKSDLLKF